VDAGNLGRTTTMYFTLGCTLMVASSPVKYQIHTKVGGMVLMSWRRRYPLLLPRRLSFTFACYAKR